MAKYTLELRTIWNDTNYNLFDFDYEYIDENLKEHFQARFFEYYFFYEIGFPTLERFKFELKNKLHTIIPYYKKMYEIELACEGMDFITQKDLTETFTREIRNNSNMNSVVNSNGSNNNENMSFHADTPQSKVLLEIEKYLSSADKDKGSTSYNDNNVSETNNETTGIETTTFHSKGAIGVDTQASIIMKWRDIIINLDEMILNEFQDLFMQVY